MYSTQRCNFSLAGEDNLRAKTFHSSYAG